MTIIGRISFLIIFMGVMLSAIFIFQSDEDQKYLDLIERKFFLIPYIGEALGNLMVLFILVYGTPAYIILLAWSRISDKLKIEAIKDAIKDVEDILTLILRAISIGFSYFYFKIKDIQNEKEQKGIIGLTSNVTGMLILVSFQLRQLENLLLIIIILSIFLGLVSLVLKRRNANGNN